MLIHAEKLKPSLFTKLYNNASRYLSTCDIEISNRKIKKLTNKVNLINNEIHELSFYRDKFESKINQYRTRLQLSLCKEGE